MLATVNYLQIKLFCPVDIRMRFSYGYLLSKEKNKVYTIGLVHCILVTIGIWSLAIEMIDDPEPVSVFEGAYVGLHYAVHFILILCLFVGACIDIPYFLLPWLCTTLVPFSVITVLTLKHVQDLHLKPYHISICLLNFVCVGTCWFSWYIVFSYFKESYKKDKITYEKVES